MGNKKVFNGTVKLFDGDVVGAVKKNVNLFMNCEI